MKILKSVKRIISVVTVLTVLITLTSALTANAARVDFSYVESIGTANGFNYAVTNEGKALIVSYIGKEVWVYPGRFINNVTPERIDVPDVIDGNVVDTICTGAFNKCEGLKELRLSSNIVTIESNAILACNQLEKVVIPSGVKNLRDKAITNCYAATIYAQPESVASNYAKAHGLNLVETKLMPTSIIIEKDVEGEPTATAKPVVTTSAPTTEASATATTSADETVAPAIPTPSATTTVQAETTTAPTNSTVVEENNDTKNYPNQSPYIKPSFFKFAKSEVVAEKGSKVTVKLMSSKTVKQHAKKTTWSSSNKKVAKIARKAAGKKTLKAVVKCCKKGTAKIFAKVASGKKYSCKVTVK